MRGATVSATMTGAMSPADFFGGLYISFWIPTAVLTAALVIKLPSIVKLWKDPLLRAVGGLLLLACSVFLFAVPSVIAWTNRVVGVPNIAAPWVYSLITAYCAACLLLIVAWRNGPADRSPTTRRAMRWVVSVYAAVIVVLWVLFALADVPQERLRDLDTYYATTPFMREEILLYLAAHTAACLITCHLIRSWVRTQGLDLWLRGGLKALGIGYALNLVYDASKLTALVARWTGHDLDWMSTHVAPPVVAVAAIFIAVGFILPHGGQYLHERWRVRVSHRRLRPLYLLTRSVSGSGVPFALRATAELRLTRRETFIRDALLQLARHFDDELHRRAYAGALALGHGPGRARALAAAVTIQDALAARKASPAPGPPAVSLTSGPLIFPDLTAGPGRTAYPEFTVSSDLTDLLQDIDAVSRALRHPAEIEEVRTLATGPTGSADSVGPTGSAGPRNPVDPAASATESSVSAHE
ncbi:MAB_1171c family putative transporter [Streptomyces sp. NPDC101112]|uniref:MAB_1171c family putative transporter n=1 Tax=Streptomyces sp. NPDC101112 TaxID=3366105 RepID=UPI00381E93C6